MPSGYSGTPLLRKLGLKKGMKACAYRPVKVLVTAAESEGCELAVLTTLEGYPNGCDYIHVFLDERGALEMALPRLKESIKPTGMIWVSWPKKTSKVPTEIVGNDVRMCGLAAGLVDVKVCAVDEVWSGLKFMIRVKDRK